MGISKYKINTVAVLGHFDFGNQNLSGQVVKTKVVTQALKDILGNDDVSMYDTHGGLRFLLRMPLVIWTLLKNSRNAIMMPAYGGIKIIPFVIMLVNCFWRRRLHYVVIGGWLSSFCKHRLFLRYALKRFYSIYVETESLKNELVCLGFSNVIVMPNCKHLPIVSESSLSCRKKNEYKVCTFSRVTESKGISEAIDIVKKFNKVVGKNVLKLDIYGQIEQKEWFDELIKNQPDFIYYAGTVQYDKSVDVLKEYYCLLFPTYYYGECFPGTLIDAMSAGIPVIASDWHSNRELVIDGQTGFVVDIHDIDAYVEKLLYIYNNEEQYQTICRNCIKRAYEYKPSNVIKVLTENLI